MGRLPCLFGLFLLAAPFASAADPGYRYAKLDYVEWQTDLSDSYKKQLTHKLSESWTKTSSGGPSFTGASATVQLSEQDPGNRWFFSSQDVIGYTLETPFTMTLKFSTVLKLTIKDLYTPPDGTFKVITQGWLGPNTYDRAEPACRALDIKTGIKRNDTVPISINLSCTFTKISDSDAIFYVWTGVYGFFGPWRSDAYGGLGPDYGATSFRGMARFKLNLPYFSLKPKQLALTDAFSETFEIVNEPTGIGPLAWTAETDTGKTSFLKVSPASGKIPPGQSAKVTVSADPAAVKTGQEYPGWVHVRAPVSINQEERVSIAFKNSGTGGDSVRVSNPSPAADTKLISGSRPKFTAEVEYRLNSAKEGDVQLVMAPPSIMGHMLSWLAVSEKAHIQSGTSRVQLALDQNWSVPSEYAGVRLMALLTLPDGSELPSDPILYSIGPAADQLSLDDASLKPSKGTKLKAATTQAFEAKVQFALGSRATALLALRLEDELGVLVQSSDFVSIERTYTGTTPGALIEKTLQIPAFKLPKDGKPILIKALMLDNGADANVLASSFVYKYEFEEVPNLSIDRIEAVQTVQDESGSVPLIGGKRTVARVFVKQEKGLDNPISGITGKLRAEGCSDSNDCAALPGMGFPLNSSITAHERPYRNAENHSLNFSIPTAWTTSGKKFVKLTAEIKAPDDRAEGPEDDNTASKMVSFARGPDAAAPLTIGYLRINNRYDGTDHIPSGAGSAAGLLWRMYPVSSDGLRYFEIPIDLPWNTRLATLPDVYKLIAKLNEIYELLVNEAGVKIDRLMAWSQQDLSLGQQAVGIGDSPHNGGSGKVAWALDHQNQFANEFLLAHELAHTFGLRHTMTDDSSRAACVAQAAGYTDWSSGDGTIQEPGFDAWTGAFKDKQQNFDFMTYCEPSLIWSSPFHFGQLKAGMDSVLQRKGAPASSSTASFEEKPPARRAASGGYLLVTGTLRRDGSGGTLAPVHRLAWVAQAEPSKQDGAYCLVFKGTPGELSRYCFDVSFAIDEVSEPLEEQSFLLKVPAVAETTRLTLVRGESELASLSASSGPPTVTLSSPAAGDRWEGMQRIAWSASDPDSNPLVFLLQYSYDDGASWLPLATDLRESEFWIDTGRIQGGTKVWFRVTARNGLDTGQASVGPVEIVQKPKLEVSLVSLDYGNVSAGEAPSRTVIVKNSGSGLLNVSAISSDNAAYAADTALPFFIRGGEERAIAIAFRTTDTGEQKGTLTIETDAGTVSIGLTAVAFDRLVPDASVSAISLDFGTVKVKQSKELPVVVRNTGAGALTVSAVTISGAQFGLSGASAPFTVARKSEQEVKIRFTADANGTRTGTLAIQTDDPSRPKLEVKLTGKGEGGAGLQIDSESLAFGNVDTGKTKDLTLTLANTGTTALSITSLASSNAVFTYSAPSLPFTIAASGQQKITVRFAPAAARGESGTLTIASNDPVRPSIVVALSGTGQKGTTVGVPAIETSPTALAFGDVAVGQNKEVSLLVRNTGAAALTVSSMTASPAAFAAVSAATPFTVAAGSSQEVKVRFSPPSAGKQSGTLTISSNDPSRGTVTVSLEGNGSNAQTVVMQLDDGTFETSFGMPDSFGFSYYVNRFTPSAYPATLNEIQIYFSEGAQFLKLGAPFMLVAGASSGSGTFVHASVPLRRAATVDGLRGFVSYRVDEQPLTIQSGDFLVGFATGNPATLKPVSIDASSSGQRSYFSSDGSSWTLLDALSEGGGNFAIRAKVTVAK
jgi:hypothetical protein